MMSGYFAQAGVPVIDVYTEPVVADECLLLADWPHGDARPREVILHLGHRVVTVVKD